MLRQHQGFRRRRHARHHSDRSVGDQAFRRSGNRSHRPRRRLPGEAGANRPALALQPAHGFRLDGHLPVQHRRADPGVAEGCRGSRLRGTISGTTFCPEWWTTTRSTPSTSSTRTRRKRCTGATWERWRPITKPTWTWSRWRRYSTCTTVPGRFARTCGNIRRPSSSSTIPAAPARRTIPSSPWAASSPAAR